jgi:HD superfamily phosphohydrolase
MRHQDKLYGVFELPAIAEVISKTSTFRRLDDISMDTLPREAVPYGVATRAGHSLGVERLALDVINHNSEYLSSLQTKLLLAGSMLHDAGNPPLSHLTEPFLWKMKGKNGESFLENILAGSEAAAALSELFGVSSSDVVAMVTGKFRPFSDVLHGSIDIDNLDNVLRYEFASTGRRLFDARRIASSYRFRRGRWEFTMDVLDEVRKWQAARKSVYGGIYGHPHLVLGSMAYRAVDLVFAEQGLPEEFFRFTDSDAFAFLQTNENARHLIEAVLAGRRYEEVTSVETIAPEFGMRRLAESTWNARGKIAKYVASNAGVPPWAVCAYFGKGRDVRKIDIPFVDARGKEYWDDVEADPIYRLKVFVHPEYADDIRLRDCARLLTV